MTCPKCKATIGDDYPDCPYCGMIVNTPNINNQENNKSNRINYGNNNTDIIKFNAHPAFLNLGAFFAYLSALFSFIFGPLFTIIALVLAVLCRKSIDEQDVVRLKATKKLCVFSTVLHIIVGIVIFSMFMYAYNQEQTQESLPPSDETWVIYVQGNPPLKLVDDIGDNQLMTPITRLPIIQQEDVQIFTEFFNVNFFPEYNQDIYTINLKKYLANGCTATIKSYFINDAEFTNISDSLVDKNQTLCILVDEPGYTYKNIQSIDLLLETINSDNEIHQVKVRVYQDKTFGVFNVQTIL